MPNKIYYPLMLNAEDKPCVIIGGGTVAERKAEALIEAGAHVTVISPECSPQLERWGQDGTITIVYESYRFGLPQLNRAFLVFAATDKLEVNAAVRMEAESMGKLVNVADDSERSGFIVPATVRRGKLLISVSTAGASPAVARKVKQELELVFGQEYEEYLDLLQELRLLIQQVVSDTSERQDWFRRMLEWDLLPLIRLGRLLTDDRRELYQIIEGEPTSAGMERAKAWLQNRLTSS
ncbi:precorrin-2 dehydrogenase/sirohydrochlorin ferrochelatase family protein [Paenibacillus sp. UNC451MF]|uniref:precorrin-2 dehydrogenase/sirohydrochlorin ferrochelatase family protein n=1 Tax=Paenibacillus sp. UNC451MF TaxID=1449063 RepID=UPI00068BDAA4|nr:bifunctional precorrin-2 dehydrogenase/sirohydrochlorin ferrochelatase [Paenibacillus sp. UNC451MF]